VEDKLESLGRKGFIAYASPACREIFGLCGRKSLVLRLSGQRKSGVWCIQFVVLARGGRK